MRPTFDIIEPSALGELSPAVQRALVGPLARALVQIRRFMSGYVEIENLRVARVVLTMTSGVELGVALPVFGMPALWQPGKAVQVGTTTARRIADYGLNEFRPDGQLGLTCSFDAAVTCTVTGLLWAG